MTDKQEKALNHLSQIKSLVEDITKRTLEIEALRYQAQGVGAIRYDKEKVQTTPQNYMEIALIDANEKELQNEEDLAILDNLKADAYSIVRQMEIPNERIFIEYFFLNNFSIPDVAEVMHFSERTVYYVREDALEHYGELIS